MSLPLQLAVLVARGLMSLEDLDVAPPPAGNWNGTGCVLPLTTRARAAGQDGARLRCATRGLAASSRCATWRGNGSRPIQASGRPCCGSTKREPSRIYNCRLGS